MKLNNCYVRYTQNIFGKGKPKENVAIVTREYKPCDGKYVIYNRIYKNYEEAHNEAMKIFSQMGAYV